MEEISDHAAEGNELRAVAEAKVEAGALAARFLKRLPNWAPRGTRHDGARKHYEVIAVLVPDRRADSFTRLQDELKREAAAIIARRRHDQKGGVRARDRFFRVCCRCATRAPLG